MIIVEQLAFVCKGMGIAGGTLSKTAGAASFALIRGAAAVQIDAEILLKQLKQNRRRFGSADPRPDQYPDASRPEAQGISYRHFRMGLQRSGSLYTDDLHWLALTSRLPNKSTHSHALSSMRALPAHALRSIVLLGML
jgi:hypothetical protein